MVQVAVKNCFISEITVAELKFGIHNSSTPQRLKSIVEAFIQQFTIIPIFNSLDIYALEKARLRKTGLMIDDFDLLIGATAIANKLIMVTKNTNHFSRLNRIQLEDWTTEVPK